MDRLEFGRGALTLHLTTDLRRELLAHYKSATILADSLCYETGAITRIHTVCLPTHWVRLSDGQRREFISSLGVTHALLPAPDIAPGQFRIVPMDVDLPVRTR